MVSGDWDCWRGWHWPHSFFFVLFILSHHILNTNTRSSSTHWKLVAENGKDLVPTPVGVTTSGDGEEKEKANGTIVLPSPLSSRDEEDVVFQILASTVINGGTWKKTGREAYCPVCPMGQHRRMDEMEEFSEPLECGKPTNFTYYDQLMGIANRNSHPMIPEPQVALHFKKKGSKKDTIDLNSLERKLRKAKKEKPTSIQLYNQIGNFNRIKGHTLRAIECFRRALSVAPNNPEVLLNLAKLLFTLQYLDDSLFLARRSLELQAPDRNAWAQHFALGEILKAFGHHNEALLHFRQTLELRPDHEGAQEQLRELETLMAGSGLNMSTLFIIVFLAVTVMLILLSTLDNDDGGDANSNRPGRHFSRALAMRSLKLGISPRTLRSRRST